MSLAYIFIYLQLLDLLTTLVGFRLGASEASPFIRMLMMGGGTAAGVMASKVLALALGAFCVYAKKNRLIRWASYWYGGLVVWNLLVMLSAAGRLGA